MTDKVDEIPIMRTTKRWGTEEADVLSALCVDNLDNASPSSIAALKRVADGLSLALIHDHCHLPRLE